VLTNFLYVFSRRRSRAAAAHHQRPREAKPKSANLELTRRNLLNRRNPEWKIHSHHTALFIAGNHGLLLTSTVNVDLIYTLYMWKCWMWNKIEGLTMCQNVVNTQWNTHRKTAWSGVLYIELTISFRCRGVCPKDLHTICVNMTLGNLLKLNMFYKWKAVWLKTLSLCVVLHAVCVHVCQ